MADAGAEPRRTSGVARKALRFNDRVSAEIFSASVRSRTKRRFIGAPDRDSPAGSMFDTVQTANGFGSSLSNPKVGVTGFN
jgi:hypothetical protein